MKRLICFLIAVMLFCPVLTFAENTTVIDSYQAQFSEKQGTNSFYFCESTSGQIKELEWCPEIYGAKAWVKYTSGKAEYPMITAVSATPGGASDFDLMFVAPRRGTVRLAGLIRRSPNNIGDSTYGDGVRLSILKNSRVLWSGSLSSFDASIPYDTTASVAVGDKIHFRINCGQHNYYDSTIWWPKVDYISNEYVRDEYDPTYYQKKDGELKELTFDNEASSYIADDKVAFISDTAVMPSDKYSLVKRFKILENGRYRVYSSVRSGNTTSFGNIARVYKNGEEIWKQLLVAGEACTIDIGVFAEKDDYIDVEIGVNEYGGFNRCDWNCDAIKYLGTLFKECDTSVGASYSVKDEYTLSSFIKNGGSSVNIYTEKYVKEAMKYADGKYTSAIEGESDYVTEATVCPGTTTDAVVEVKLPKDGILKLTGDFKINNGNSDGVLIKAYLNDRLIWSNRVGSENSLRWDDPYDEVYFLNNLNGVANVKAGDSLSFKFDKWRSPSGDVVDISDIKLSYISGDVMSKTTRWKLDNSTVIDSQTGLMHKDGVSTQVNVSVKDGVAYIAKTDIEKIFGERSAAVLAVCGGDEIKVRDAAKAAGMAVNWSADRMILLYTGISAFFGYPEGSEIRTQLEIGGDLFA